MSKVKKRARSEADNPENSVDKSRKVAEMIRYCLFRSRKAVPLKRSDLSKAILSDSPFGLSEIYPSAREKMKKIFGMDLVEVSARTAKSYVLVNELNAELRQEFILRWKRHHTEADLGLFDWEVAKAKTSNASLQINIFSTVVKQGGVTTLVHAIPCMGIVWSHVQYCTKLCEAFSDWIRHISLCILT
eukprot:m.46096 g.46096  ORF g.46096 m.46096 type:complete len:188 (+) comp33666_c0_seq6:28-591(+)